MPTSKYLKSLVISSLLFMGAAHAADIPKEVTQFVEELGISSESIRATPAKGIYELLVGTQIFYVTADGKYLFAGNMLDLETKENLTDTRMKGIRLNTMSAVADDQYISYNSDKPKHTVTIFTDIDCGYCRKLHSEMDGYNKLGISVKYLFFPRTGPGTESFNKAISVWCNKDRNTALTDAKAGKSMAAATCSNPVAKHFKLGSEMGVSGTPYIITEQGDTLPGYMPPAALRSELDKFKAAAVQLEKQEISKR